MKPTKQTIKVDESELDMFAKYGVKSIQKGNTEIKLVKKPLIDISNNKYNRLTALEYLGGGYWSFKCECGKVVKLKSYNVKNSKTKSCGCLLFETKNVKHGKSNSRTYNSWRNLKTKYKNQNTDNKITVCKRWLDSFENFYKDMGECPEGFTIERIDNSKGYYKKNCKWASYKYNNKRNNIKIEYKNKIYTLKQLCDLLELNYKLIYQKLKRGRKKINVLIPNSKLL